MDRRSVVSWIEEHDHAKPIFRPLWRNHFYLDGFFNTAGGMWLVMIDGLFFIPILFAAFFYPIPALSAALAMLIVSFVGAKLYMMWERKQR
jgi:hypothetical protein